MKIDNEEIGSYLIKAYATK